MAAGAAQARRRVAAALASLLMFAVFCRAAPPPPSLRSPSIPRVSRVRATPAHDVRPEVGSLPPPQQLTPAAAAASAAAASAAAAERVWMEISIGGKPQGRVVIGLVRARVPHSRPPPRHLTPRASRQFGDVVPKTTANFAELAQRETGGFKGTPFHRVIQNFMIQACPPAERRRPPRPVVHSPRVAVAGRRHDDGQRPWRR